MAMVPPQQVQLQCPSCRTPFTAVVWSMLDVGQEPQFKNALISGQINVAVCPKCGAGGMLATPMVYHDPAKQLFFTLLPQELNLKPEEQERFVGEMSRAAMEGLAKDAPRGYLLTPRRFMSMQSLLEAVLEAEGISKETLQAQRARVELLSQLAEAFEADRAADKLDAPESQLAALVASSKAGLDYDFFMTLSSYIDAAAQQGRDSSIGVLSELRDRLVQLSGFDAVQAGLAEPPVDEVIEALLAAPAEQLEDVIANYRPLLDEDTFEAWAERLEAMGGPEAEAARARMEQVRATVERMDEDAQQMFEAAAGLLREVLEAEDPDAVLREHSSELNEAFLVVLDANLNAAGRAGQNELLETLIDVRQRAIKAIQDAMTPEERLINQLLSAETPAEATKLLRKSVAQVTPAFVKKVNELAEEMDKAGRKEVVERLRQVGREAASLLF
ncbi:MAG TPA: CpXC domain-containing protein [Herpetosiphonaceae bacterium]